MAEILFTETHPIDRTGIHLRAELNGKVTERIIPDIEIQYANFDLAAAVKKDMRDQLLGIGIYAERG